MSMARGWLSIAPRHTAIINDRVAMTLHYPQIADLCNKGAGKIGDLIDLETIWKKLHFGHLKVSNE